jgi:hypothetical protein
VQCLSKQRLLALHLTADLFELLLLLHGRKDSVWWLVGVSNYLLAR